jgi:hypothetical protein
MNGVWHQAVFTLEDFSLEILERRMQLSLWQIREMSTLPSAIIVPRHAPA